MTLRWGFTARWAQGIASQTAIMGAHGGRRPMSQGNAWSVESLHRRYLGPILAIDDETRALMREMRTHRQEPP